LATGADKRAVFPHAHGSINHIDDALTLSRDVEKRRCPGAFAGRSAMADRPGFSLGFLWSAWCRTRRAVVPCGFLGRRAGPTDQGGLLAPRRAVARVVRDVRQELNLAA